MTKYLLDPTDLNIWTSIKDNKFGRANDIKNFIEGLELIDSNACIGIDAKWGEGKTFFVRQIEETLKFLNLKQWSDDPKKIVETDSYEFLANNSIINSINLNSSYLPVYYNAWAYDNHNDPLMSLLINIKKICEGAYNTKISTTEITKKIIDVTSALSLEIKGVYISKLLEGLKSTDIDILSMVKTEEEVRRSVKGIFNDIIVERAQKLVIFIDELDRCRPSFAIEMLERIKHYMNDERIIFVISINKDQLVHTISNYYGRGFDATGYLNKFFDLTINLPEIRFDQKYILECDGRGNNTLWMDRIADGLGDYYHLSLRDRLVFKSRIETVPVHLVDCLNAESLFICIFVPCILLLDIVNSNEKTKFIEGKSDFIEKQLPQIDIYKEYIYRFFGNVERRNLTDEERLVTGYAEVVKVYKYVFGSQKEMDCGKYNIDRYTIRKCMDACNRF